MPRWLPSITRLGGEIPTRLIDVMPGVRDASRGGRLMDPGSYFSIAAKEVSARHPPELNGALGGIYISDALPPQMRGEYRTNGALSEIREEFPLLDIGGMRTLMGNRPYGRILLNPNELPNLEQARGTLEHEYYHHERNYKDPQFNSRLYHDTLKGLNPYAELVFKAIAKKNPTLPIEHVRYAKHQEEREANIKKALAMSLAPLPRTKNDQHIDDAADNYLFDMYNDWLADPRWQEAEDDALLESMHQRGLIEPAGFDERYWE